MGFTREILLLGMAGSVACREPQKSGNTDIQQYYEALNGKPYTRDFIKLPSSKEVVWYNFTDYQVNKGAAQEFFNFLEVLGNAAKRDSYINAQGRKIDYEIRLRGGARSVFFIVPQTAPNPAWASNTFLAGTANAPDGTTLLSKITVDPRLGIPELDSTFFPSFEKYANLLFLIEACQSMLGVVSTDSLVTGRIDTNGQEIIANSLGRLCAVKTDIAPFTAYDISYRQQLGREINSKLGVVEFYPFLKEFYDSIPQFSPVIRKRGT